jgi:hypothetical protein
MPLKKYYEKDRINILEKKKNDKFMCECGTELTKQHKARHEKTKKHQDFINGIVKVDTIKEYKNLYWKNNKDKLNEKRREKYECDCGSTICKGERSRHQKSKKHQEYIKTLEF